jgi:hypothetical protein
MDVRAGWAIFGRVGAGNGVGLGLGGIFGDLGPIFPFLSTVC